SNMGKRDTIKVGTSTVATQVTQTNRATLYTGKRSTSGRKLAANKAVNEIQGPFKAPVFSRLDQDVFKTALGKSGDGDLDQRSNRATTPGEGPIGGFEAYRAASRTYPADEIAPQIVANARATFQRIANADANNGDPNAAGHKWSFYAPLLD